MELNSDPKLEAEGQKEEDTTSGSEKNCKESSHAELLSKPKDEGDLLSYYISISG
jgi:hypothetical protein